MASNHKSIEVLPRPCYTWPWQRPALGSRKPPELASRLHLPGCIVIGVFLDPVRENLWPDTTGSKGWDTIQVVNPNPSVTLHLQYLIAECMTSNDDGLRPPGNWFWDLLQNNGFTEYSSPKDVPDLIQVMTHVISSEYASSMFTYRAVRRFPHPLEIKFC